MNHATDQRLRVLIVDDDDLDRERIRRHLASSGMQVTTHEAESGQEALALLRTENVDCVLLDNQLGDTTGAVLLQQMRQLTDYIGPVIMVTGAGNENVVIETMRSGASDYVIKHQLNATRLVEAITHGLQAYEKHEADRANQKRLSQQLREQAEALRQLDRTLQDILDQTSNLIGYWDRTSRIRFCNRAHHEWLGFAPGQLVGMHVKDALGPDVYAIHQAHIERALGGVPQRFEHALQDQPESQRRVVQVDYRPDQDEFGHTQGFYVTFTDLTQLVNARNQAQDIARVKGTFLANMSHEIRTPMNAIVGLSRIALEKYLPDDAREDIERVHDAAIALTGILDDILDHSKLEAGQMRIECVPMVLDDVLRRTSDLFSSKLTQKRLCFDLDIAAKVPHTIRCDALRLSQILNNLVGNAVKFTEHGGVTLSVAVRQGPSPMLRFEVRDTGIGIEPSHQAALFTAFTQEDPSITRRFGGSGLGLSICRSLVLLMAGEIGVISQPNKGSTFWFEIPLLHAELDASATKEQPIDEPVVWVSPHGAIPGLLSRARSLNTQQWHVATGIDSALPWLAACRPDTPHIVVDWHGNLQHLSAELTKLQQHHPALQNVLLIVDGPDKHEATNMLASPTVRVMSRPVMPEQLRRALMPTHAGQGEHARAALEGSIRARGLPLQGKRILLVDDNPLNVMVAEAFLQQAGLHVITATNGEEAVALAQREKVDAILMDMHMPIMDGLEATRRIRQFAPANQVPILAMTAAVLRADREQCLASGMVDVIPKPIMADHLIDTLLKWIPH